MSPLKNAHLNVLLVAYQVIFVCISAAHTATQPPYQVYLYVSLHPNAPPLHYCNGVIVQSRLVLTTATCIYYPSSAIDGRSGSDSGPVRIPPAAINVVPGVADIYSTSNAFGVLDINIAQGFNSTTLANNLAILRLNATLPLGQRDDIQWIILDEYAHEVEETYLAAFSSLNVRQSNQLLDEVQILSNEQCQQSNGSAAVIRSVDICALSPYSLAIGCESTSDFHAFNSDQGTGLINRGHLVAIFSHTIASSPLENLIDCRKQQPSMKAVFATVGPHLNWIYDLITRAESLAVAQNDFIQAAPYQEREEMSASATATSQTAPTTRSTGNEVKYIRAIVTNTTTMAANTTQSLGGSVSCKPTNNWWAMLTNGFLLLNAAYFAH